MGEKFIIIDNSKILEIYLTLIEEEIEELSRQELFKFQTTPQPQTKENKLSVFKICNPFWLTFALLRGIIRFLWSPKKQEEVIYVSTKKNCYKDINHWSDDNDDESDKCFFVPINFTKFTQTDREDITFNKIESALADLITMRKFKEIVPSNRRTVKRMSSCYNFKPFKTIDHRNRRRYGGKVIKPKLSKTRIIRMKNSRKSSNSRVLDVHDVMNHLLYIESSDDESD